jgi:hypothetical protein
MLTLFGAGLAGLALARRFRPRRGAGQHAQRDNGALV